MSFSSTMTFNAYTYDVLQYTGKMSIRARVIETIDRNKLSYYVDLAETYQITTKDLLSLLSTLGTVFTESYNISVVADNIGRNCVLMTSIVEREDPKDPSSSNKVRFSFFSSYSDSSVITEEIKTLFKDYEKKFASDSTGMYVSWGLDTSEGLKYSTIYNPLKEALQPQAYPYISDIETYVSRYISDEASVLLFMGKPGTGKTRFLRYIVQKMSIKMQKDIKVLYTMDAKVFSNDRFFIDFFTNDYDLLILEDIDLNLRPRSDGNDMMHKLLASTDGFIRNNFKKIVLTTNLTNVGDIDSALLREGRCFGKIESRLLSSSEGSALLKAIEPQCEFAFSDPVSVAKVYQIVNKHRKNQ